MKTTLATFAFAAVLSQAMCFGAEVQVPQDGEVLLHLSFDNNMDSVAAVSENLNSTITGTPVYDDDVWKLYLVEWGNITTLVRNGANQSCLYAPKTKITKKITHPFIKTEAFDSATIEFFMKGSTIDGEVATWENKLSLGAGNRCGLMIQASNNKEYYVKVQTDSTETYTVSPFPITDGKWHHFAIIIESVNEGKDTKIKWIYDYGSKIVETTKTGKWAGFKYNQDFTFGAAKSVLWLDEFRITKGSLSSDKFMRFSSHPNPQDGDTLFYMTFDETMEPIAGYNGHIGEKEMSGAPVYDAISRKPYVYEYGNGDVLVRKEADICSLKADKTRVVKPILHPYMTDSDLLDSATIEFFMKGSSVDSEVPKWKNDLSLGNGAKCGLMVQADDNKKYYVRVDTDSSNLAASSPFLITDGKWHHFAIVITPIDSGVQTQVTWYFDYKEIQSYAKPGKWAAFRYNQDFSFGESSSVLWLDEFRISKGVLPKSRFMKLRKPRFIISVR